MFKKLRMNPRNNSKNFAKFSSGNVIYDKYIYFLVAVIALLYFIDNFIWLRLNIYPHGPDEFSHLLIAQNFYNCIVSGQIGDLIKLFKLSINTIWPPLFHLTAVVLSFILGFSCISPLAINLVYLFILLFSVYSIGCKLYDKKVGTLAVILISLYPMVFRYSRFFGTDFAQISVLSLSIYFLICSEHFSNRKFCVLFGVSIGIGMLTKWSFILFLFAPLACFILQGLFLRGKSSVRRTASANLFLSLLIGILLSLTWYWPSSSAIIIRLKMFFHTLLYHPYAQTPVHKISEVFGIDKFFGYFCLLINEQISFLFFLVFILAAPYFFRKRFNKLLLISWYIFPFIALSLSSHKEGRFMLPALPAIALISAAGLQEMFSYRFSYFLKHLFCALIIFLGLAQFFDISYNYERKDKTFPFETPVGAIHMFCYPTTEQHRWAAYGPPFKKNWEIDKVAFSIAKNCRNKWHSDSAILVGLIGEDDYVRQVFGFPNVLDYYLARINSRFSFRVIDFLSTPKEDDWSFIKKIDDLNFVVFISGLKSWPEFDDLKFVFNKFMAKIASWGRLRNYLYGIKQPYDFKDAPERLRKFIDSKDSNFLLTDEIKLADGYYAYVYMRR